MNARLCHALWDKTSIFEVAVHKNLFILKGEVLKIFGKLALKGAI